MKKVRWNFEMLKDKETLKKYVNEIENNIIATTRNDVPNVEERWLQLRSIIKESANHHIKQHKVKTAKKLWVTHEMI